MPFVKLDCGILTSTLWFDRDAREVFITALLMAQPAELEDPLPQLQVRSLDGTGWIVPPGWYGFVPAAGPGIIRMAGVDEESGTAALEKLGAPEPDSRSSDFDGRRLVRVNGGYVVLNYMRYRERDTTAADRTRRWREKKKARYAVTQQCDGVALHPVTQAEERRQKTEVEHEQLTISSSESVLAYWQEKSGASVRSEAVREKHLKRIAKLIGEGFAVKDLQRCVDVACWDKFYVDKGYYKQPDVIFRNAERVNRLLSIAEHEQKRPLPL